MHVIALRLKLYEAEIGNNNRVKNTITSKIKWFMALSLLFACQSKAIELKEDPNRPYVIAHCTACHSAALITQNRMTRDGWLNTIRWMQEKQGLWPLGEHEDIVLDYLAKHYYPEATGRRKPLAQHLLPEG